MKHSSAVAILLACSLSWSARGADEVAINEIMYHPFHTAAQAEDTGQEWVELFNRGPNAVSLHGWRLAKGIEFSFTNMTLPPGGYLVVVANRTNFLARFPSVTNVAGNWAGRLSNTDDELRLLNDAGEEVSRVAYADSGDWAVRARESVDAYGLRGWGWLAPQDGGGMTLELINPARPNQYGQNWSASTNAGGTPGAANSVLATNSAPFVQAVAHFPLVPRSVESVTVVARIDDEQTNGLVVTLFYRNAGSASPPAFTAITMFDDGAHGDNRAADGLFGAVIPAQANGTVIEFYVSATDAQALARTWPAPARNAPDLGGGVLPPGNGANALFQVDDSTYNGTHPFCRIILPETERAFLAGIAGGLRNSDAAAHGTFVSIDPNGTAEHHATTFRRRGAGSRSASVPNYRVNFATDRRWKGVTGVNLNSQYPHSQVAGSVMAALAGLQAEFQKPAQVRVNGANLLSGLAPFAQQELPDGDYASLHFPNDPNGNVYRGSSGSHSATLSYLGTDPNSYIANGYSKTANGAENDWSDLISLTDVLNNTPDDDYLEAMQARVNVQQWMTYFAVFTLLDSRETSLGIGSGDDFGMYRGLLDPRFQLLGHDFDTIFSQGDVAGNVNDDIFRATSVAAVARFLRRAEFAPLYYRTLTNLMATAFAPEQVSAALDQHLSSWVNAGVIASMKSFSANRNAGVLAQIPLNLSVSHALPVQNGYPRSPGNTATLFGSANAIGTRTVLVNGLPATWSQWNARWTNTVALFPGVNRVLVQSLDAAGNEFERTYLDVWHDDGTVVDVSFAIENSETWTAAGGPYNITNAVSVRDGAVVTIEPGTTVYLAPGATLSVFDSSSIIAQGTETKRIRIGRNPAVAGNWGSLDLLNSAGENRFAYVDFDSAGGTTLAGHNAQIHVNNSRAYFDHCLWPATPAVQYISFDASSFIVQHCTFPTYPAPVPASAGQPEMLHGVNGIPPGGYGIFRDNYFGHTWGASDTIDFTGGHRPGAILQVIGNVFDGASDDHLDLDSTDAWIEGNVFLHAHRDPARTDQALDTGSAISGGVDVPGQNPDWTIINNLFYDVDHVFLNKGNSTSVGNGGGRVAFLYNTVAHVARENSGSTEAEISVFNWSDDNIVLPDPALGSGLYAAHNIIYDAPALHRFYDAASHTVIMENNILPAEFLGTTNAWTGPGGGNRHLDPRLNLAALNGVAVSNATAAQVRSAFQLLSGSPALGAGFGARDLGGLNPHGLAIDGAPTGTNTSTSATLRFGPGGTFDWGTNAAQPWGWTAFRWKLDNGPWSAVIPVTNNSPFTSLPSVSLSNLNNGPHTVSAVGRSDAGYFQDNLFVYPTNSSSASNITATRTWFVDTNLTRLVLNEVLARNVSAVFADGKFSDLIELRNAGTKPVDLGDMSITDDPAQPRKYIFPLGTTLAPGAYLVLYAATGEAPGRLYVGFSLKDSGEGVYLYNSPALGGALLDSVNFGLQLPDLSIGRLADGTWALTQPTLGAPNVAQPVGAISRLKINEWLAASGEIFQQDFIELFNADPLPVALGGLGLSHSPISAPLEHVIAPLSFIAGRDWQSFVADNVTAQGPDHLGFKLDADGGWLALSRSDGTIIDMIVYATQFPDVSQGRSPDGGATFVSFNQATPGGGNPAQSVVVTAVSTTLIPLTQTWRAEASGVDLGTAWRATNYNDAGWLSGPALFWNYDGSSGEQPPITANTTIPFTNPKQSTVYFRTTFNLAGATAGATFLLSQVIDDGCVLYLNNQEVYRYNMPSGVISYSTFSSSTINGAPALVTDVPVTLPGLGAGTNYLALELHQANLGSSDLAMALRLESRVLVTNFIETPVVLSEVLTKNNTWTNAAGLATDWVELFNPSTNLVDISDLSLTDDPARPRRWVFPQGAAIPPGGYYVLEFDDSQPSSPLNAGFELSADSGAVYLFHRPGEGGQLLDSVVYGVQVADLSLGRAVSGLNPSWTLCQPTRGAANATVPLAGPAALKVNEWMPNPPGGEEDWFEIYNPNPQPVALGGLRLTDDLSNPIKHTLRALSFIGAGPEAWLKFIADNNTLAGGDHVPFRLANTEAIGLYNTGTAPAVINSITYANAQNGVSYGRLPDGASNLVAFPDSASPEESNWLPLFNSVVINEVLTSPIVPLEQSIELRNPGATDVAIAGWFLSNARKDLKRYLIPPGTLIPANGFKVFYEAQFNPSNDIPPSFALNSLKDDEIILSVADANGNLTGYRTSAKFGPAAAGTSFGRHEKSSGDDFVALNSRTFGADNPATVAEFRTGGGAANAYPRVGPLVINEIHYHPPDGAGGVDNTLDEFIEISNGTATPARAYDPAHPTNTWRLRDAVDFEFPASLTVGAFESLLVVSFDPATNAAALTAFRAQHGLGEGVLILGPWRGKLDNSSESVELQRPDAPVATGPDAGQVPYILVERVKYSDSTPWPSAADGNPTGPGFSLHRLVALNYGNEPLNWIAGVPTPGGATGLPGGLPPTIHSAPWHLAVTAGNNVIFSVLASGASTLRYQWRFNGGVISGATNATYSLPNTQTTNAGSYSVIVANPWGAAFGGPARLTVVAAPQIVQAPQSRTVVAGSDTTFIVTASGGSLRYQWRFGGANIPGATGSALTLPNVQPADAGGYDVIVSNTLGSVTSAVATLTVIVAPAIASQPQHQAVIIGNPAVFTATATGTAPLRYQWQLAGANLPGATNASLTFASAQPSNAGSYALVVTNIAGRATSAVVTLTVIVPPTVTVAAPDATAAEPGADTGTITFTRGGSTLFPLTLTYSVSGSATPGSDYASLSEAVTIPPGASSTNVLVTPMDDAVLEGDETVLLTLLASTNYLIAPPGSATVVIHDDDNAPPVISILTPTNSQLFPVTPAAVSFTVDTSDPNGSVARVEFFSNATNKLGESSVSPFNFTWTNAPAGSNALTARATDDLGSTTDSAPVPVVLNALPSVGIVSPVSGTAFGSPAMFTISAFASDADGSVTQVSFYANAALVGSDATPPFSATASGLSAGGYALRAVAYDNRGVSSTSAVVTIVVNQPGVFDDFEPDIDLSQWSAFGGVVGTTVAANSYGGSVSPTHSLWFGDDNQRFATTRSLDASLGGTLIFQLRISNGNGQLWENADLPGEGVVLEYSINGGSGWINIATFDTQGAPYTQGWTAQQYPIPAGAQTGTTLFRWRQLGNSGSCCDHWAIDDVQILVGPTPPNIVGQPVGQNAIAGGSAAFAVTVFGSSPFGYQWQFNGTNIAGATDSTYLIITVSTNHAGLYSVVVTNTFGTAISSNALLTVIEANSEYFRILALTTNNVSTLEHYQLTSYDSGYVRGGIGVSASQVIVSGGVSAGRFSAANLTGGVTLGTHYDALVTDLRTETVYCFGTNATGPAVSSSQSTRLTHLLELNGNTGLLTGNAIPLSLPISVGGYNGNNGFYSGYGRAVLRAGTSVFHIALPSGAVADLGTLPLAQHNYSYNWGFWGLVESTETGLSLIHASDSQTMVRTFLPGGATTNFATYANLGYYFVSMSFSVTRSRWYFDNQYGNQFAPNGTATVGFGDAQYTLDGASNLAPTVLVAPQSAVALAGGRASFAVSAVGDGTLTYQWRFNDMDLPGAIAPGFVVLDVQPEKTGLYSVVISNAVGSITTAPVALTIALPPAITAHPQSQTVLAGTLVTFSVTNTGDGPFTYVWRFEGDDYTSTTNGTLTLNPNFYYNGRWSVEVRNAVGIASSSNATLVVLAPPFLTSQPAGREMLRGMNATLTAVVDGTAPYYLQWFKDGALMPGATNPALALVNTQPTDVAGYTLIATNAYGAATSIVATVTVVEPDADSFAIRSLETNAAIVTDVFPLVSYVYQNGLAANAQRLFLNGYGSSGLGAGAGFNASDLTGGFAIGAPRNGLVSDLRTRKIYSLAAGTNLISDSGGLVTSLVELDGLSGQTTTNIITLSINLSLTSYSAVFSGFGRVVLADGNNRVYDVVLPSGQVTYLGTVYFNYLYAYGFAYRGWGIAERIGTNTWLAHVRDEQTIERVRVPNGVTETIASFSGLGDYAGNFTLCLPRNRWYFNHAGSSQFGGNSQNNLVSANASFVYLTPSNLPPVFLDQPASQFAPVGSTVTFLGLAEGSSPLTYQWRFQGAPLASQTNAALVLTNVRSTVEGAYSVAVSNPVNTITSVVATLTVNYGASTSNTVPLVPVTGKSWKYNQTTAFFNNSWIATNYNDSTWSSGNSALAVENLASLTPLMQTTLTIGRTSYYFRCTFNVTSNFPPGTLLRASTYIDDGAVIYMNGREFQRVRMPSGSYNANTFAPQQAPFSGDAGLEYFYGLASTNLVLGTNVIAAEVHQASATSSDIFWAMGLDALVPLPNRPPVITNQPVSRVVSNGVNVTFSVGASGTPPFAYQWRKDGTNLPGAASASLLLTNVQRRHAGTYAARVTNPYDVSFSSDATLTVLVPPIQILGNGIGFSAPGQFTLNFLGDAGGVFAVETSTNLLNWTQTGTVTNTTGTTQFNDPTAGGSDYRFYRLRLLP